MNFILLLYISSWVKYGTSRKIYETKSQLRVLGGTNASIDDYPYIVRLAVRFYNLNNATKTAILHHVCTGTTLTETWTLTAAHCIIDIPMGKPLWQSRLVAGFEIMKVIHYGKVTSSPYDENTYSEVISFIAHPGYRQVQLSTTGLKSLHNDVGLLHTHPIILKQYGKLSSIDYTTLIGEEALAAGYGITQAGNTYGNTLKLKLPLQILKILIKRCGAGTTKMYPGMCIARRCGESATLCPGDSGGPVVHSSGVVGVTSFGMKKDCLPAREFFDTSNVGFITPVSPYVEWITNHVKGRNHDSSMKRQNKN